MSAYDNRSKQHRGSDRTLAEKDKPEDIVKALLKQNGKESYLSVSQIRKLLTGANLISNKIKIYEIENNTDKLPVSIKNEIKYLRIRFLYQVGKADSKKENPVRKFGELAGIDRRLKEIDGSIEKYKQFNRFIEEIVAYHKYYGGN